MTIHQFNLNIKSIMSNPLLKSFSERLDAALFMAKNADIDFDYEYDLCPKCGDRLIKNLHHQAANVDKCPTCQDVIPAEKSTYIKSDFTCAHIKKDGEQCKTQVKKYGSFCYVHRELNKLIKNTQEKPLY